LPDRDIERRLEALEIQRAREHNEKMRRAGMDFAAMLGATFSGVPREAFGAALHEGLRRKYGLKDEALEREKHDGGDDAA
jgi:hypothetical protein